MMFARIRRTGAFASLAAAIAFVAPVGGASAAVPGQPKAVTITPEFASTIARGNVGLPQASGVQVAQNRNQVRQRRATSRRNLQRTRARSRTAAQTRVNRPRPGVSGRTAYRRGYNRGWRNGARHYYGGRWYRYNDNNWYDDGGAIVAAGLIGLAAGAAIGSSYGNTTTVVVDGGYDPYSSGWYQACANKYRSFRASDGTYLGYDGLRHTCRIP